MRIRDWSSDVFSSDLLIAAAAVTMAAACGSARLRHHDGSQQKTASRRFCLNHCFPWSGRQDLNLRLLRRSEEHTSELQSLMRISYAVFCLKKKKNKNTTNTKIKPYHN